MASFSDTYEVRGIIGKGGMSTVYLAEHQRLHTRWAAKVIRKQQAAKFDFLAESNILKRLQHPMLPRIVDIFESGDQVLIVEDFVEGVTLEEVLKQRGKVDETTGLQWFRALCDVLGYLHNQQPRPIIYRDLKPSNIMLQPDGSLKLIDFGIAREYKQESSADTTYIGTKGYAAPEQFGRAQTDARTDIYALGVTMYHLLTGKSPYEPPYQFVPARQLAPNLSHGIEYILSKCIQPEPVNRYQSVAELLDDLNNMYRFDRAWKKYKTAKRVRVALLAVMFIVSAGLIAGGWATLGQEKEADYFDLLEQAGGLYASDPMAAIPILEQARELLPQRIEADRQRTYVLYLTGDWEGCVEYGNSVLEKFGPDTQTRLAMAAAQFELGDYEAAAEGFAQGDDLSIDYMCDYAVCLGRLGQIDKAQQVLERLTGLGAHPDVTRYVQGEVYLAQENYLDAEAALLSALEISESNSLTRRCYVSLSSLYRACAALFRNGTSPIDHPATRSVDLLSQAMAQDFLRYDSTLWESLGQAYFESYHTDSVPSSYLERAADCFNRVIELGITKEYLYANIYTIYYELGNYSRADRALTDYQQMFPSQYTPHALRGILLITIENEKPEEERNYSDAVSEYELAGSLIKNSDDITYYQQLGTLIDTLRANGWL